MRTHSKFILAALATALVLSLGASTAAALRSIGLRPAGAIVATASLLSFTEASGGVITSSVTLTGSLNRAITKRAGASVGSITSCRANEGRDTGGLSITARIRCELNSPWPITYTSFRGTLPRISSILITIEKSSFLLALERAGLGRLSECLYGGVADNSRPDPIGAEGNAPSLTTLEILPATVSLVANLEELNSRCSATGRLTGRFTITTQTVELL